MNLQLNSINNLTERIARLERFDIPYHLRKLDEAKINFEFTGETRWHREMNSEAANLAIYLNQRKVLKSRLEGINAEITIPMEMETAATVLRLVA